MPVHRGWRFLDGVHFERFYPGILFPPLQKLRLNVVFGFAVQREFLLHHFHHHHAVWATESAAPLLIVMSIVDITKGDTCSVAMSVHDHLKGYVEARSIRPRPGLRLAEDQQAALDFGGIRAGHGERSDIGLAVTSVVEFARPLIGPARPHAEHNLCAEKRPALLAGVGIVLVG